jgi:hypothetical protein
MVPHLLTGAGWMRGETNYFRDAVKPGMTVVEVCESLVRRSEMGIVNLYFHSFYFIFLFFFYLLFIYLFIYLSFFFN